MQTSKPAFMIRSILSVLLVIVAAAATAQVHTQIIGDSVRIRSNTGTAELILENSTKNVNGFLYNKGNGRTEFRQGLLKLDDSTYVIGTDTINLSNCWKTTGNLGIDPTKHFLGTIDSARLIVKTKNVQRMSVWENGVVNIAPDDTTSRPVFRIYPNGDFSAGTNNDYTPNQNETRNGIRFNKKLGIFEIGISNNVDTTLDVTQGGQFQTSGLIINSDLHNTINSPMISSILSGDNVNVAANGGLYWSIVAGESHTINGGLGKSLLNGYGHRTGKSTTASLITGTSNALDSLNNGVLINGYVNADFDTTYSSLISGSFNRFSGGNQFISGTHLTSQGWSSATIGSGNVIFSSLPPLKSAYPPANLGNYPLLSLANGNDYNGTVRSQAVTVLFNGRTQINTTGYDSSLSENDVTPKAAFEVVSKNSGVLIPRLSDNQRDSIISGDLHNGLLIYNSDSSQFQYYNGSGWRALADASPNAIQSLHDSSTVVWNTSNGSNATITLAGTDRAVSISNPVAGQTYRLKIVQDGTGNRTIGTWPSNTMWPSGIPPALSTTAASIDMVTLYYDGSYYYGDYKALYKTQPTGVSVYAYDNKIGSSATVHSLTSVPAGALLVVTTTAGSAQTNATITSSPSLTWTKRVDASATQSGDAEIYTAVYTAGGSITITSDWGNQPQESVAYVITNQESSLGGATANATAQGVPSVSITTTRANSLIIAVSSDWNAINSTKAYLNSATETGYNVATGAGTFYHYYKQATTATSYTMGLSAPTGQKAGTALIEIRGN